VTPTPETTPISTFCVAFPIFLVGEHTDFKFGVQVDHNLSQPKDDTMFLKGTWSRHVIYFKFLVLLTYLWLRLKPDPPERQN